MFFPCRWRLHALLPSPHSASQPEGPFESSKTWSGQRCGLPLLLGRGKEILFAARLMRADPTLPRARRDLLCDVSAGHVRNQKPFTTWCTRHCLV